MLKFKTMLNIFKTKIPKEDQQEVTELKSFTVKWSIWTQMYTTPKVFHKVIIHETEAKEFKKQLEECAKFVGTSIRVEIWQN